MFRLLPVLLIGAFAACGGSDSGSGSGLDTSKKLTELSAGERDQLCTYMVDAEGGTQSKKCGDITITVQTAAQCSTGLSGLSTSCAATVDNAEACAEAAGDDLCNLISSQACSFLLQCSQ